MLVLKIQTGNSYRIAVYHNTNLIRTLDNSLNVEEHRIDLVRIWIFL